MKAFATDKQAPFGGIIICNRPLDLPVAKAISEIFSEVIIAPEFASRRARFAPEEEKPAPDAGARAGRRLTRSRRWIVRSVRGGLLVQQKDAAELERARRRKS